MIERLGRPMAIAVATGAILAGCADVPPQTESVSTTPTLQAPLAEAQSTILPKSSVECVPVVPDRQNITQNTVISFVAINDALIQKHIEFKPLISRNPMTNTSKTSLERSASFLRVTRSNTGSLCTVSEVTDDTTQEQINNVRAAISADADYIQAAFDKAELDEVDFRLVAKDNLMADFSATAPAFEESEVTDGGERAVVNYILDPRKAVSIEDVRTMLRHETIHALTSKADMSARNEITDLPRAKDFADACRSLRNIAVTEASAHADEVVTSLRHILTSVTPEQAAVINQIIGSIQNRTFDAHQPVSNEYDRKQTYTMGYGNIPECKTIGPWFVSLREMEKAHIDTDNVVKLITDDPTFQKYSGPMIDGWNDLLRQQTIYSILREAPYMSAADETAPDGHPWDNWDETITSLLNVTLTYPEVFVNNVHQLPPIQAKAVKDLLGQSKRVFSQLHPEMAEANTTLENVYSQL